MGEHQARTFTGAHVNPDCRHCGGTGVLLGDVDQPEQHCPCPPPTSIDVLETNALSAFRAIEKALRDVPGADGWLAMSLIDDAKDELAADARAVRADLALVPTRPEF